MFDPKDEITNAVTVITQTVVSRNRGAVVAWPEIEKKAGFKRGEKHWSAFVRRLKRDLRDKHGLTLCAVKGVGYKVETVDEQLNDRSIRRHRRARRQVVADVKDLAALPDTLLSDHQRTAKHRKIDQGKTARRAVDYSLRLGHQLAKPSSSGLPRPMSR
jgi:hypothetical protein